MVTFDKCVYKRIRKYSKYIVKENLCSIERTIEKVTTMIRTVIKDIDGGVIYRLSLYKQFGNPQGYRLYVYKDPRSKSQWGFAYEKLPNGDVVICGMTNMKLIKESDDLNMIMSLMERIDNIYK